MIYARKFSLFVFLLCTLWIGIIALPGPSTADPDNTYTMGLGCIYPTHADAIHLSMVTHGEDQQQTNAVAQVTSELVKPVNVIGLVNNSVMALAGVGGEALGGDRSENVMCNSFPVGNNFNSSISFKIGDRTDTRSMTSSGGKTKVAIDGPVTIDWQRTKASGSGE